MYNYNESKIISIIQYRYKPWLSDNNYHIENENIIDKIIIITIILY